MKTFLITATLVAALVTTFALADLGAQQPPQTQPGPALRGVALIDIAAIMKQHQRYLAQMEKMKGDALKADADMQKENNLINKLAEKLSGEGAGFKPGTPEYKKLEEDLTQRKSNLQVHLALQRKEFAERESKIVLAAFKEVNDSVRYYAERNAITMVLRFENDEVDSNNRQSIMNYIARPVLYSHPGIDITAAIVADLNRSAGPGPAVGGAPQGAQGVRPTGPAMSRPPASPSSSFNR